MGFNSITQRQGPGCEDRPSGAVLGVEWGGPVRAEWWGRVGRLGLSGVGEGLGTRLGLGYKDRPSGAVWGRVELLLPWLQG